MVTYRYDGILKEHRCFWEGRDTAHMDLGEFPIRPLYSDCGKMYIASIGILDIQVRIVYGSGPHKDFGKGQILL